MDVQLLILHMNTSVKTKSKSYKLIICGFFMSVIKNFKTKEEVEVSDGKPIEEACEKLGVPFGCEGGVCGSCMVDVVDGEENLSELTEEEESLARDKKHRLACQCKVERGNVTINF